MESVGLFLFNSFSLGVGLSMDAFSVSLVNGMNEPGISLKRSAKIAGVYSFFQGLMPMTGWIFSHTMLKFFSFLQSLIPWIALALLLLIGGKMIREGRCSQATSNCVGKLSFQILLLQGIATSIDALSVGIAIASYTLHWALVCASIVAGITFLICFIGVRLGKRAGGHLSGEASLLGGLILIAIGIEILLSSYF